MEIVEQNPAKRLQELIQKFVAKGSTPNAQGFPAINTWMSVLEVDASQIINRLTEILNLIKDIEHRIKCDPLILNKANHLSFVQPLQQSFLPNNLNNAAIHVINSFFSKDSAGMIRLEFSVEALSKSNSEIELDAEDLTNLTNEGQDLFNEINSNVGSPELKRFLLELLSSYLDGINAYKIRGVKSLDDSVDIAIGRLTKFKNRNIVPSASDKTLFQKALSYFDKASKLADKAKKVNDAGLIAYDGFEQVTTWIASNGS